MNLSEESKQFFSKLSKIWQNFSDYNFLEGIQLSSEQINIIEQEEDQLLIEGYAGTGKSITLIYKFINILMKHQDKQRILYVTFNSTLIEDTKKRLNTSKEFLDNKDKHDIRIMSFHEMASELLKDLKVIDQGVGRLTIDKIEKHRGYTKTRVAGILDKYENENSEVYKKLSKEERLFKTHDFNFVADEIAWIKATGLIKQDGYLNTVRIGRSNSIRLTVNQRKTIFKIFQDYQSELKNKFHNWLDLEDYALKIIENAYAIGDKNKFDYILVDEVQDLDPMQVKALCMLTKKSIVLSGDAKQRIYRKSPLKYEDIGLKIREKGKRRILYKNFRSTAQIVRLANSLNFNDTEDKLEEKTFVKEGPRPIIYTNKDHKAALKFVANEIKNLFCETPKKNVAIIHREEVKEKKGYGKSDIRIFLEQQTLLSFSDIYNYGKRFDHNAQKQVFYTNVYDVKGLEFDVVFVIDFSMKYYPNLKELNKLKEENESSDKYLLDEDIIDLKNREKKLLYVAMTRAREKLYLIGNGIDGTKGLSEFAYDFNYEDYEAKGFAKKELEKAKERFQAIEKLNSEKDAI